MPNKPTEPVNVDVSERARCREVVFSHPYDPSEMMKSFRDLEAKLDALPLMPEETK